MAFREKSVGLYKKTIFAFGLSLIVLCFSAAESLALEPPRPGEIESLKAEGKFKDLVEKARELGNHKADPYLLERAKNKLLRKIYKSQGMTESEIDASLPAPPPGWLHMPSTGVVNTFTLLIEFNDHRHSNSATDMDDMLYGDGDSSDYPLESLSAYYNRSSYGLLDFSNGTTLGWYRTSYDRDQVTETTTGRQNLIKEALNHYENLGHDFSQYDNDGDGDIDYFLVIWAGPRGEWLTFWWGYYTTWGDSSYILDGKRLRKYSWQWESDSPYVVIHETGHALGLPDYYDYDPDVGPDGGVGRFDMMDANRGDHNCFSKWLLDWITPMVVSGGEEHITLRDSTTTADAVLIWPEVGVGDIFTEFFMVQNRQDVGNDSNLFSPDGLSIWHVDATLAGTGFAFDNSYTDHKLLRLMEADGLEEIETGNGRADTDDLYTVGDEIGPNTTPPSDRYSGANSGVRVWDISDLGEDPGAAISARFTTDDTHPVVVSTRNGSQPNTNIYVTFSEDMNEATFTNSTISVVGTSSGTHNCLFSFNPSTHELTIDPISDFVYPETVTATIGTGVTDLAGNGLASAYPLNFYISSPDTYTIIPSAGSHGSISPDVPMAVLPGDDQSFMAVDLDAGYEVDKWYLDGNPDQTGGNNYTVFNVQSNHLVLVTFKLSGGSPSEITVTSPNGGEPYGQRNRMRINWEWPREWPDIGGYVKIDLYKGGSPHTPITDSAYNSGSYSWRIPDAQPIGSNYRIRITSVVTPAIWDESDGNFSITAYIPPPDRIEISTLNQLRAVSENLGTPSYPRDGYYVLMNDIDASDTGGWNGGLGFQPIGTGSSNYFRGIFDGQGYKITELEIDRPTQELIGLFSVLMDSGIIKNLTLEGGFIRGRGTLGALIGECNGTVINCHSSVEIRGADIDARGEVGGLIGYVHIDGRIRNCSTYHHPTTDSRVRAYDVDDVGGIAGSNAGTIEWCSSTLQSVRSNDHQVGGIAGSNWTQGTIRECYSGIGNYVRGDSYIGGIVGYNSGTVTDCYSGTPVEGPVASNVGGVVGQNDGGTIERCHVFGHVQSGGGGLVGKYYSGLIANSFWDINTTAIPAATPCGGGCTLTNCYGKTTAEMKQQATFEDIGGWDFNNVWCIAEGVSYPNLRGVGTLLPQPTGLNASTGLRTGVHLSWNPMMYEIDGVSYEAVYRVYVSDSDAADAPKVELSDWQSGSAYIDATAVSNVTYYYWVKAAATTGGARESDFSASAAGSRDYPPMDTPANVTATDGLPDLVLIQWDPVPSASHYRVYRADSAGGAKTALGSWQTDSSFPDTPPTGSTVYYYWVTAAIDALGERESNFGGPDTGWFYIPEQTPPSVSVISPPELPIETQDVSLSVSASDNDLLNRIVLHWNDGTDHTQTWENIDSATFDDSHSIGSFSSGQEIMYWAEAWDRSGNKSESSYRTIVIQPEEVVSPERPSGEASLQTGEVGTYSTAGSSTNLDHPVEYQFDWGDGQQSEWESEVQSYSWDIEGAYSVKARAQCQTHTDRESAWSFGQVVYVDSTDPLIEITTDGSNGPGENFTTCREEVVLEGVASDTEPSSGLNTVSIDTGDPNEGSPATWRFTVVLAEGPNTFVVSVSDNAGNIGTDSIVITLDTSLDCKMFDLITTPTTSVNAISLCLEETGIYTADDLGAAITGCDLVSKWDADTQSYYSHVPGVPDGRNFDLVVGEAYFVSVTENSTFELIGLCSSPEFTLITTATTSVNAISLPCETDITTAEELCQSIPGCDLVSKWDAATQSYLSHVCGVPDGRNFDVYTCEAYFVSVTDDIVWP